MFIPQSLIVNYAHIVYLDLSVYVTALFLWTFQTETRRFQSRPERKHQNRFRITRVVVCFRRTFSIRQHTTVSLGRKPYAWKLIYSHPFNKANPITADFRYVDIIFFFVLLFRSSDGVSRCVALPEITELWLADTHACTYVFYTWLIVVNTNVWVCVPNNCVVRKCNDCAVCERFKAWLW